MRIGNRQFSPKPWSVLLYLLVLAVMLMLGVWQMNRAALKVSFQQAAATAAKSEPVAMPAESDLDSAVERYQRVELTGRYDDRQYLWDNRTHKGVAGFEVITPFETIDGQWVLVNRGWVAPGATREQLPAVALPADAAGKSVTIEGFLSRPSQGFASGAAIEESAPWPKLMQYFDYDALSGSLGVFLVPVVVQGQALGTDGVSLQVPLPRPEWLVANWQPAASGPLKHYSYAFQWFAMATALTILFLVVNLRVTTTRRPDSPDKTAE